VPRRRTPQAANAEALRPPGRPHSVIEPNGLYFLADVIAATKAKRSAVRAAIAEGKLRAGVIAGRYVVLGTALLDWIRGAPAPRKKTAARLNGQVTFANGEHAPAQ
jgi:hypothetical protein